VTAKPSCVFAERQQAQVDRARMREHSLGLRPYKATLVWQVQDPVTSKWSSAEAVGGLEIQLLPVLVKGIGKLDMIVQQAGRTDDGIVSLFEISPAKFDERTLLGWRDGADWLGADLQRREFFYEIQLEERGEPCPGAAANRARRMIPAGAPEYKADTFEWRVRLTDQFGDRSPAGVDQTTPQGFLMQSARLVP
jgi:hypothetical protein